MGRLGGARLRDGLGGTGDGDFDGHAWGLGLDNGGIAWGIRCTVQGVGRA